MDAAPISHTVNAACARIGVGRTFLYDLIARGEIRVIKLGTRTLVPESELRHLIESRLQSADFKPAA